jgi:hypothetical protein
MQSSRFYENVMEVSNCFHILCFISWGMAKHEYVVSCSILLNRLEEICRSLCIRHHKFDWIRRHKGNVMVWKMHVDGV